jgi:hypothetical protein
MLSRLRPSHALVALLLAGWPGLVTAQTEALRPGFGARPPIERAHGSEVDAFMFAGLDGTRCGGFVGTRPEFRFEVAEPVEFSITLLNYYTGSIVVHGADGVRCSGIPTMGARLSTTWPPGTYQVYIGAPNRHYGGWVSVSLAEPGSEVEDSGIVGGPWASPYHWDYGIWGVGGYGLGYELDGAYQTGSTSVTGTWQAALPAEEVLQFWGLEGCPGAVSASPAHELFVYEGGSAPSLYADAPADAIVLIEGPLYTAPVPPVRCVSRGADALLHDFTGGSGRYRLWVGAATGTSGDYQLRLEVPPSP